ncbi:MAG: MFS transporter [Opitutales bacterium]|nr:MFS transporter [Opitutales bacterium]
MSLLYFSQADHLARALGEILRAETVAAFGIVLLGFFFIRYWGQGVLTLASRNMAGKWFNRYRGIAIGFSSVTVSITFSASPSLLNLLVETLGWRGAWSVLGIGIGFGVALFIWYFFRDNPEECGLQMDGRDPLPPEQETNEDLIIYRDYQRADALRTYAFWIFTIGFSWHALLFTAYAFHVVDIGRFVGIGRQEMFLLFFYAAFVSVVTNLAAGWLSTYIRLRNLLILQNLTLGAFALAFVYTESLFLLKVIVVISMGIGGGLWGNLNSIVYPRFFGRQHVGAISGFAMSAIVIASALGPYFFSLYEGFRGDYQGIFLLCGLVSLLLAVGSFWGLNPQRKEKPQ